MNRLFPTVPSSPIASNRPPAKPAIVPVRFLQGFILCLAASGWWTMAERATFAQDATLPTEADAALHLVCVKQSEQFLCQPQPTGQTQTPALTDDVVVTATLTPQFLTAAQQDWLCNILLGVTYLLPVGLGLGLFMSDRYTKYRATVLNQQIQVLERIWQQNLRC